jgi:hypothetical protein
LATDAQDFALGRSAAQRPATSPGPHARTRYQVSDLNQLRMWIESQPEVPEGPWYKDFGSFKICGEGTLPKTFLLRGQVAKGQAL